MLSWTVVECVPGLHARVWCPVIWNVGWGNRPVDPWEYLGPEAMVAWDRDMAPHMDRMQDVTSISVFSYSPDADVTEEHFVSSNNCRHQAVLHGCSINIWTWHSARYFEEPTPHWVSTFNDPCKT